MGTKLGHFQELDCGTLVVYLMIHQDHSGYQDFRKLGSGFERPRSIFRFPTRVGPKNRVTSKWPKSCVHDTRSPAGGVMEDGLGALVRVPRQTTWNRAVTETVLWTICFCLPFKVALRTLTGNSLNVYSTTRTNHIVRINHDCFCEFFQESEPMLGIRHPYSSVRRSLSRLG